MANGFSLQEFMSKNKDFARGYTFYVSIASPYGVSSGQKSSEEDIKYLAKSTVLPTNTITVAETNWQGNAYKLGTTHEFAEWSVSFNVDIKDNIRHTFASWSKGIHNPSTNEHGRPATYLFDLWVEHIDQYTGSPIMAYKLIGAWPSAVGELTLDYAAKDMATFDVTFTYQYHTFHKAAGEAADSAV